MGFEMFVGGRLLQTFVHSEDEWVCLCFFSIFFLFDFFLYGIQDVMTSLVFWCPPPWLLREYDDVRLEH